MFSISMSVSIPNLDNIPLDVDCPVCRLELRAQLRDVRLGRVLVCRGCKRNVHMIDHMNQLRVFKQRFERILNSFGR